MTDVTLLLLQSNIWKHLTEYKRNAMSSTRIFLPKARYKLKLGLIWFDFFFNGLSTFVGELMRKPS